MDEKTKVWVRSGGRCCICGKYLLTKFGDSPFGEAAHILPVSEQGPRGEVVQLEPDVDRDSAENMMLLCANDHRVADKPWNVNLFDVAAMREIKRQHEARVFHALQLTQLDSTTIVRVVGDIRGETAVCTNSEAASAILAEGKRFPEFVDAFDGQTIECDLGGVEPTEAEDWLGFYEASTTQLNRALRRIRSGIDDGKIRHLSVFAFLRMPLLVRLGNELGDLAPMDAFQRNRSQENWIWPSQEETPSLELTCVTPSEAIGAEELALVCDLSYRVERDAIPAEICDLPRIEIRANTPGRDLLRSAADLRHFGDVLRSALNKVDTAREIHLFAAVPIAAAVEIGRSLKPDRDPAVQTYHDVAGKIATPALRVNERP